MFLMASFMITVMLFCSLVFFLIFERKIKMKKRIDTFVGTTPISNKPKEEKSRLLLKEKIKNLRNKGRDYIGDKISSQKEEELEKKLLQTGNPWNINTAEFQMYIFIFRVMLPIVLGVFGRLAAFSIGTNIVLVLTGLVLGRFLPNYYINSKIKNRYKKALRELPDFLDLLTVSLEAGLGFDMALNKVISKGNGILTSEFHTCLEEIRIGKTRREALSGVKERLGFNELKALINSILQAEKLGMSMVQIFRIKSLEEREKRRQRAEEQAMKAPVKILFPLVIFIFPSIFIVILGPVVLQFITSTSLK